MTTILFIENGRDMALALRQALATTYHIRHIQTGADGVDIALRQSFSAILLDLQLPDMAGITVCEQLRAAGCKTPIVVLTGEGQVLTKIKLLDAGANDYITKPFSLGELKARLRAAERSVAGATPRGPLSVGDLTLDVSRFHAERGGQVIKLRRKEFALLECLMQQPGTLVTRDRLSNHAWRQSDAPWANTIDVHMKYLRDKIDRPFAQPLIQTVHGLGYKIQAPAPVQPPAMQLSDL